MTSIAPRVVVVSRDTEWQQLLARHGTPGQARFFLETRGQDPHEMVRRDELQRDALAIVERSIPTSWRRARVARAALAGFLFEPNDIVVAVGQDGLVPNLAKYASDLPVIGVNPDPDRYEGSLVRFAPSEIADVLDAGRYSIEERRMVECVLDDGQRLVALNEIYVGHETHQSSRYLLACPAGEERQSSSGIIVATGTGAGGWARSIALARGRDQPMPSPTDDKLVFFVREAWPSVATGASLTSGLLGAGDELVIRSEMEQGGVAFGDGIEHDRLLVGWGQRATVRLSDQRLRMVAR